MIEVTNVTCFGSASLLGVAPENILFSWQLASCEDLTEQQGWQLQLSRDPDFISPCYDTGWVNDSASVNVALKNFIPLSCTRYWFRVRVKGKTNSVTAWSEAGWFETALLTSREWKAHWITGENEQEQEPEESVNYLSHCFHLKKPLANARLYASALGIYQLCINQQPLDKDLFSPGWTSYDDHVQFQSWDIGDYLHEGENSLIVSLAEGWYKGELSWLKRRELYGSQKAFIGQIHLVFTDGDQQIITSDNMWRCGPGPILKSGFYSGEIWDARVPNAENIPKITADWSQVRELTISKRLIPQVSEPVRITEIVVPESIMRDRQDRRIIDMGQNMVGRLRIRAILDEGETLTFHHAEVLDQHGELYTDNLRNAQQKVKLTGNGRMIDYASRFSFQGFRFVAIEGGSSLSDEQLFEALRGEVLHTDMARTGDFSCDNLLINQLFRNIVWGQRGNFLDIPTDCPQRDERLGWTGDAHIFIRTGASNFNVHRFFRKWLMSVSADQKADGTVPMVVPDILRDYISKIWGDDTYTSSGWGDAAVICPWVMWQMYGDRQLLSEQYPSMKSWVQYIHQTGSDPWIWDSGFQFGDWLALDAEPDSYFGATPVYLVATAFYAWSTHLLGRAARALGEDADAQRYESWFDRIAARFRQQFMQDGRMIADTQTAHILPLAFGLLPPEERQTVADRLYHLVEKNDFHLTTGFLGTPWLCHVLSDNGHHQAALRLACQTSFPSWLFSVEQGATTIWEHWDGIKPDGSFWSRNMNSFNHYAYGAIGEWLYRYVAGLDCASDSVAWSKVLFRPDLSGIAFKQAAAHYDSIRGRIAINWTLTKGCCELKLTVPGNTQAELLLPQNPSLTVSELNNNLHWKQVDNRVTLGAGSWYFMIQGLTD